MGLGDAEASGQAQDRSEGGAQGEKPDKIGKSLEQGASEAIRSVTDTFPDFSSIKLTWERNIREEGYDIIAQVKIRFKTGYVHHEVGRRFIKDIDLVGQAPNTAPLIVRSLMEQAENMAEPTKK